MFTSTLVLPALPPRLRPASPPPPCAGWSLGGLTGIPRPRRTRSGSPWLISAPGSLSKPHPRWRPGSPQLSTDSQGLRQPPAALGSGGIHSPPVPTGIREGCHRLRAAAAAGPAPESERERGCECARRPAVALCVSCVCGVARACVSVSVRVRADTATPASRRAGLQPAEGPGAGRRTSGDGDHCVCPSVRLCSRIPSQASPLQTLLPLRRLLPQPQARSQTHATRRGPRWALALLQLQRPVRWLHRGPPSPGHPPSAPPGPAPPRPPLSRLCLSSPHYCLLQFIQQLEAKLPRVQRPTRGQPHPQSPHLPAPLSAYSLTRCSAPNHWRALRWGCCVPILQAGQLRWVSRVLAQS